MNPRFLPAGTWDVRANTRLALLAALLTLSAFSLVRGANAGAAGGQTAPSATFDSPRVAIDSALIASDSLRIASDSLRIASDSLQRATDSTRVAFDSLRVTFDSLRVSSPFAPDAVREPARRDTLSALQRFLRELSRGTDERYARAGAPIDTMGLDSALTAGLSGHEYRPPRRLRFDYAPWFEFDRVDGPLMGASLGFGPRTSLGHFMARLGYANGPNRWFGGGGYERVWRRRGREVRWTGSGFAGRSTEVLDLDRRRQLYYTISSFLTGDDGTHYLQRDGVRVWLERNGESMRARLGFRDQLESPRATTATWNLYGATPGVIENFPATLGRTVEWQALLSGRPLRSPIWVELDGRVAARVMGGDFDYRRLRIATGAEFALGRMASLLPQLSYGRLSGDLSTQSGFWLGGSRSLRSLRSYELAGRNAGFGRVELVSARDVLSVIHVPHPGWLDLQPGVFAASGAVWGGDPLGGPTFDGGAWPANSAWVSEAGASILYRPGLPDPEGYFRFTYARPLGANSTGARWSIAYSLPLDLLRAAER